ncbi:polysaccharide lyase family 3 protein [Macroventuria anomochaeta]|uniref:Polysaccharide lyase family 3 protein n=1 Tax=Macroventuria anomochaeta TaxID=301207 RepID=A0ACB6RY47_9PLEO|nr:polysaccharide lyase family 3 protein [Macroventuria anomochaeta]KAF2626187.1 polysaccharide lyase family 3 protein [Macroventuria anomochaeta]
MSIASTISLEVEYQTGRSAPHKCTICELPGYSEMDCIFVLKSIEGNCSKQYTRKSSFTSIKVVSGKLVAGVNGNEADSTTIKDSCLIDAKFCDVYKGLRVVSQRRR